MLQKVLQVLTTFLVDFACAHPRLLCSIVGVLLAVALLLGLVSINLLIGGDFV